MRGWRAGAACALETEPYIDVTLHPGDMLYIPRGHQHYAVSLEKTSLHLAVALSCPKGNCLLSWLAREVFDLPSLRHVPLAVSSGQDTGSLTRVGFSTWSEEMKGAILRSLETANYVDRVRAFCEESVAKSVPVGFP